MEAHGDVDARVGILHGILGQLLGEENMAEVVANRVSQVED